MCGVVGIVGHDSVAPSLYDALTVLQHRGQDAAGIMTADGKRINARKANGLVRDVFHQRHMDSLSGNMGLGHVRYPTAGGANALQAQPFYVNSPYGICLAHNGNLTNAHEVEQLLVQKDMRHLSTDSDSEILLNVFAHELQALAQPTLSPADVFKAVEGVHRRCRGGYAVVMMIVGFGIVAFRDPHGIRPLVLGRKETPGGLEHMVASESVATDVLGYEFLRDVAPGEAIYIETNGQFHASQCTAVAKHAPCIFEYVYFARPDSIIDGVSVYKVRLRMGEQLAEKIKREWPDHDIDLVIPIPDTSPTAPQTVPTRLDLKNREG
ncbi:MAG: amidophosphoribosyltransferase, partial [Pseudomonadota bacterium]